jgi:phospholipid/cholesterol/gamma-HCH transport system substrate-binding protein
MKKSGNDSGPSIPFIRRHRNFFAGLFLLVPGILIPLLLFYTLMKAEFMQEWCHLYTTSDNSYGILKGSPVTVSGMSIGHVQEVVLIREGAVEVRFKIQEKYRHLIRKNTLARLQQKSMVVGDWIIELTGGTGDAPEVVENDTLRSEPPMRLDNTISQVTSMVSLIENLLVDLSQGKGTIGKLLTDDTLIHLVNGAIRNADGLLLAAGSSLRHVDTLLFELTALGKSGSGFVDSLNFVAEQLRLTLDDVATILDNLKGASGDISPLLSEVQNSVTEAEQMMRTLQQSWIYRKVTGESDDPLLKGSP